MDGRGAASPARWRLVVGGVAVGVLVAACGQHPGVHQVAGVPGAPAGGTVPVTDDLGEVVAAPDAAPGDPGDPTGELPELDLDVGADPAVGGPSSPSGGTAGAGSGGGGGAGASDPATRPDDGSGPDRAGDGPDAAPGAGQRQVTGSDRTGVTDDRITLAIHAPVTGAAPLPAQSFERAGDLYWRWVTEAQGQEVLGRSQVQVLFADDRFDPSAAIQVCRELASRAFSLFGAGGTDQINACGQFAAQARVPYSSAGVPEAGLRGNPWYVATTMSYDQQVRLLAQYVAREHRGQKVAAILTQSPGLDELVGVWERSLSGVDYVETLRHPKGDTTWYATFARRLLQADVDVVYFNSSPLDYVRFAQTVQQQGGQLSYVGVGISNGLNAVLGSGCPAVGDGTFLSPFPALETADEVDPDFRRAARRFGAPDDDVAWALWGQAKLTHALLEGYGEVYGEDLTREDFRAYVGQAGRISSGVFPDVVFDAQRPFGATAMHVLRADCGSKQYRDAGRDVSRF
ncbi:ABC transporter substrate-binding protein [Nitriliruptoraceae bacterium ZYF776]|nr:ABC transporter substrate-binding protein [Profundirhabdus halotolerans]